MNKDDMVELFETVLIVLVCPFALLVKESDRD